VWLSGATGFRADPNELVDALVDSGVGIDNLYRGLARRMQADERPNLPLIRRMNIACGLALACPVLATCVRSLALISWRRNGYAALPYGEVRTRDWRNFARAGIKRGCPCIHQTAADLLRSSADHTNGSAGRHGNCHLATGCGPQFARAAAGARVDPHAQPACWLPCEAPVVAAICEPVRKHRVDCLTRR